MLSAIYAAKITTLRNFTATLFFMEEHIPPSSRYTCTRTLALITVLSCTLSSTTEAKDSMQMQLPSQVLRLTGDNDMTFRNDNNYTSGVKLDYMHAWDTDSYWGLSLIQEMYTPDTNAEASPPGEHPYAGNLALGFGYITMGESFGTSTEFQVGITGKASLAGEAQMIIHEMRQLPLWDGWDNQVPSEVTLQLSSRQEFDIAAWRYQTASGLDSDSSFYLHEELGTAEVSMSLGYVYRFGRNLPLTQRRAGCHRAHYALSSLKSQNYDPEQSSFYILAGIHASYVAHDYSLDGGVFKDFESTAKRVPWQFEWQLGLGARYKGVDFFLGGVLQSERFDDQNGVDNYATFSVSWQW